MLSPRARRPAPSLIRVLASLLALIPLLLVALPVRAQSMSQVLSTASGSGANLIDAQQAQRRAVQAFNVSAEEAVRSITGDEKLTPRQRSMIAREHRRFAVEAREVLRELGGDGALTLKEAQERLGKLRTAHLNIVREGARALEDGVRPPPRARDGEHWFDFARRQLAYTVLERNHWTSYVWLVVALFAAGALAALCNFLLRRWLCRGDNTLLAKVLGGARPAVYVLGAAVTLQVWLTTIWLPLELTEAGTSIVLLAVGLALLLTSWSLSDVLPRHVTANQLRPHTYEVTRTLLRATTVLLFGVYVIEVVVATDLTAVLAGIGLVGLGLTLAAQNSLKNLMGAGTVHADRLFEVGDLVKFRDYFGEIEKIGFRSVKLRTLSGHLVTIPNAMLSEDTVENVQARPFVRVEQQIGLEYGTPPETLEKTIEAVRATLEHSREVLDDPAPRVILDDFDAYSLTLMVVYHLRETDWWEAKEHQSKINLSLLHRVADAGASFAFPTSTLHVRSLPEGVAPRRGDFPREATSTSGHGDRAAHPVGEA